MDPIHPENLPSRWHHQRPKQIVLHTRVSTHRTKLLDTIETEVVYRCWLYRLNLGHCWEVASLGRSQLQQGAHHWKQSISLLNTCNSAARQRKRDTKTNSQSPTIERERRKRIESGLWRDRTVKKHNKESNYTDVKQRFTSIQSTTNRHSSRLVSRHLGILSRLASSWEE